MWPCRILNTGCPSRNAWAGSAGRLRLAWRRFRTEFVPPIQWVIDVTTAGLLFLILGKRWAILPGLITEAIPGMAIFPVWVLVVASIAVYDDIHKPHRKLQQTIDKLSR